MAQRRPRMRSIARVAWAAILTSACAAGLYAAETEAQPSKASRRVKRAEQAAPQLRKVADKDKKAALKEQAQKLQERWARSAAESAAKAAAESVRATQEIKQLREEITRLREELAQVREAMQKRGAAEAGKEKEVAAATEPQKEPEKAKVAKEEPERREEAEAKPKEEPRKEAKEEPKAAKEEVLPKELQVLVKSIKRTGDIKPPKEPVTWTTIDLAKTFNNDGISGDENRRDSDFDEYRQAYAAELLPEPGLVKPLGHVPDLPFIFPPKKEGAKNNIACDGQRIGVPAGRYAALYVMGSATFGEQKGDVELECEKGKTTATLKLSDWCAAGKFGEAQAYLMTQRHNWEGKEEKAVCSIWVQAVDLPADKVLKAIVLPKNPKMHIFAMTLAKVK